MREWYTISPAHWEDYKLVVDNYGGYQDFCKKCWPTVNLAYDDSGKEGVFPSVVIFQRQTLPEEDYPLCEGCGLAV